MKNMAKYMVVAAFSAALIGCTQPNKYHIKFSSVDLLKVGDPVYSSNTKIGAVDKIELNGRDPIVTFSASDTFTLCASDSITIEAVGIVGQRIIRILRTNHSCVAYTPKDTLIGINICEPNREVQTMIQIAQELKSTVDSVLTSDNRTRDSLPTSVQEYISRKRECNHWGGEDAYDDDRKSQIEKAFTELKCHEIDNEKSALIHKHNNNTIIIAAINSADTLTW